MSINTNKKAVVLLSGGLDSSTVVAIARDSGFTLYALTFRYGQKHDIEIEAAKHIAARAGVADHIIAEIDLGIFGGSALTADIDVPRSRDIDEMSDGIPVTYVPARNTIFLSFALAWAEVLEATDIFIGVNAVDFSGYPDCRPEFIAAYERMANLATSSVLNDEATIRIHTPLIELSKGEIIQRGIALGVDYSLTTTCYQPEENNRPCRECDACILRERGFEDAGMVDPLLATQ